MTSFRCLLAAGVVGTWETAALQAAFDQAPAPEKVCWKLCDNNKDSIDSKLVLNNLGGNGPTEGEEMMSFRNVATVDDVDLDLVVKLHPDSAPYNPWNATQNGQHKCFGVINVRHKTSVKLDFSFFKHGTHEPYYFHQPVGFTVFDIDQSHRPKQHERITFDTPPDAIGRTVGHFVSGASKDGSFRVTSKHFGNGEDNPLDANTHWAPLSKRKARERAVEVQYSQPTWTATFEAKGGNEGRNFLFTGCADDETDKQLVDTLKNQKPQKANKAKNKKQGPKAIETDLPDVPDIGNVDVPNVTAPNVTIPNKPSFPGAAMPACMLGMPAVILMAIGLTQ